MVLHCNTQSQCMIITVYLCGRRFLFATTQEWKTLFAIKWKGDRRDRMEKKKFFVVDVTRKTDFETNGERMTGFLENEAVNHVTYHTGLHDRFLFLARSLKEELGV